VLNYMYSFRGSLQSSLNEPDVRKALETQFNDKRVQGSFRTTSRRDPFLRVELAVLKTKSEGMRVTSSTQRAGSAPETGSLG
jgi:hypothetical protein